MTSRARLRRLAACGLLAAAAGPLSAAPSTAVRHADPPDTVYVYDAAMTATVTHQLSVDWGDRDQETRSLTASLSGTMSDVRIGPDGIMRMFDVTAGSVRVDSATTKSVVTTNDGQHVETCTGSTATAVGTPYLFFNPVTVVHDFFPFTTIQAPVTCTYNDGQAPATGTYHWDYPIPELPLQLSSRGASTVAIPFSATYHLQKCAGYVEGQTEDCTYRTEGSLVLTLVRKYTPTPDPDPEQQKPPTTAPPKGPKGPRIAPGARRVTTPVRCRTKCTVTINIFGLKGGPRLTVPRVVKPKPGRTMKVTVAIPRAKRAAVKKTGGVRVVLAYRLANGARHSESLRAHL